MEIVLDLSIEIEGYEEYLNEEKVEKYIGDVLRGEFDSEKPVYLSVALVGNEDIQRINRDFRGKDQPTDVISFAYHETEDYDIGPYDTLGDIVISLERVEDQRKDYGHNFEREFYYVLTHGILHLLGYDHIEEEDKLEMREKEEEILKRFGYTRD
ncbi:MAG: rRNA maturation RNase YbeY [Cetobacterium sp.]|uniref:rRNA maturation RNase YbeY n=1 Tax=unclassified Cetobacterium TaxID=2630983 RepID=UPI00163BF393|nr:rRNA maturation RNase YbeY [Cetobacterium sp. 2A]MBC2855807.1 rRNA maturation RNase YbeY [Cetobacterium sp. 2A]